MATDIDILTLTPVSGSADLTTLQSYAASGSLHFGKIIYVASGSNLVTVPPFNDLNRFYFNENGTWHASPFLPL